MGHNEFQMEDKSKIDYNNIQNKSSRPGITSHREEESNYNSTRKLLGDELDRSDLKSEKRKLPTPIEDGVNDDSF